MQIYVAGMNQEVARPTTNTFDFSLPTDALAFIGFAASLHKHLDPMKESPNSSINKCYGPRKAELLLKDTPEDDGNVRAQSYVEQQQPYR